MTFDPWTAIRREEFRDRQDRARKAAWDAGLDGLVVYSRGGGPVDMCADVLYLTNHYSQQPYVADHVGIGSARSHGVVVLPVEGPSILIVDIPWWRKDVVVADDVRASIHVTDRVGEALRDAGLAGKRVGVVGASYMSATAWLGMAAVAGGTELVRRDALVESLRVVKTPAEQDLIRRAAEVGNRAVDAIMDAAVVGATEARCASAGYEVVIGEGAAMYDAPCASGPWSHQFTWGRLPSHDAVRPMEPGDLFHVDCYGAYGGYLWDFGRTRVVGDEPTAKQLEMLEATIEGVETVCSAIKPGLTAGQVYALAEEWMSSNAVVASIPEVEAETEGFPAVGHGIGMSWEAPWLMQDDPTPLEPGMWLAVEMLFGHPDLGGTFMEHNGLVTEAGFEVLTTARSRWW